MKNMLLGIAILLFANLFGSTGHLFLPSVFIAIGGLALTLWGHGQMREKENETEKDD